MAFGAVLATITNIMKDIWEPRLRKTMNIGTPLYAQFERNSDNYTGKAFIIALQMAMNEGVGFSSELADLPDAGANRYEQALVYPKYCRGRMQISGPTMIRATGGAASLDNELRREMDDLKASMRRDLGRVYFGDGTGKLCQVNGAVSGANTVVVDHGITATDGITARIRPGMKVDIHNGTTYDATEIQVASAVVSTTTFTTTQNVDATNNAWVYRHDAKDEEAMGLSGIVAATGALQGLNPATAGIEDWAAWAHASVGDPTELKLLKDAQTIETQCGRLPNLMVTTNGVQRAYFNQLSGKVMRPPLNLKGGFTALSFNVNGTDIPMLVDVNCPPETIFMLNTGDIVLKRLADFSWMDKDGGGPLSRVPNKDAYEATLFVYENLACLMRNSQGILTGITEQ